MFTLREIFVVSAAMLLSTAHTCSATELVNPISRACQKELWERRPGGCATTPQILAPNKRVVAWSEATWLQGPELFRTAVIVRDKITGSSETVFRTMTNQAGKIIGPTGNAISSATADQFCVIDWSKESRYLLVREVIGATESDNTVAHMWVYDLQAKRRSVIRLSDLDRAIADHWTRKGVKTRDLVYIFEAHGWEDSDVPRPAFIARVLEGPPQTTFPPGFDGILGIWSVSLSGAAPKLLSENQNVNVLRRYGEVKSK